MVRASTQGEWQANTRGYWNGRTSRASLHAFEQLVLPSILRINPAYVGM